MAEKPPTPRGAATQRRILEAAADEFARYGIAGARVDRITAAAQTNKAQLYGYFGNKDGLFGAVVAYCLDRSVEGTVFDVDDLPGWAVSVYDRNLRQPHLGRLIGWIRLERHPTGLWFDDSSEHQHKVESIAAAQQAGRLAEADPIELLTLILAMANAWSPASTVYAASADEPTGQHERRRELLRASVARVIAPQSGAEDRQ
jgi:AcrR family transcriptional regulator